MTLESHRLKPLELLEFAGGWGRKERQDQKGGDFVAQHNGISVCFYLPLPLLFT